MESLSVGLFGEIYNSGSMLGFVLLIYSSSVSALCIFKKGTGPPHFLKWKKPTMQTSSVHFFCPQSFCR